MTKNLRPIRGKYHLLELIAQGEHETQDFKYTVSDASKIARSISAFANNSGGRLLIGVKDNGSIAGVRNEEDIYVVEQAALSYCYPPQQPHFTSISAGNGLYVIIAEISPCPTRQVKAKDTDGTWKAYFRIKDENIPATDLMLQAWKTKHSAKSLTLSTDISEKSVLSYIDRQNPVSLDRIALDNHISTHKATEIICRLYALELIDFTFSHRSFLITIADEHTGE
ncbi:MAG: ATP-binding protein [Paramuribaculum sp.]|nr:ATP-binding protein [Paramuribaculum sp.]